MTEKDDILNCISKACREAHVAMEAEIFDADFNICVVIPVTREVITKSGNVTIKVTIELIENQEK